MTRKTSYTDSYAELLRQYLSEENVSIDGFLSKYEINSGTFYQWLKTHPEFLDAYDKGMAHARHNHLSDSYRNLTNKDFNHIASDRLYQRRYQKSYAMVLDYDANKSRTHNAKLVTTMLHTHQIDTETGLKLLTALEIEARIEQTDELERRLIRAETALLQLQNAARAQNVDDDL